MQLTINIPEAKVPFFMELVQNLGFNVANDDVSKRSVLTAEQITQVDAERAKINANPDYLLDWDEARKTLNPDRGL